MKWHIHYTVRNTLGGSFCKKCFSWSNMPDGLKGYACEATNEEKKRNLKVYKERELFAKPIRALM